MLLGIVVMWLSTMVYWIVTLLDLTRVYISLRNVALQSASQVVSMQGCLRSLSGSDAASDRCSGNRWPPDRFQVALEGFDTQASCVATTSLTVNVSRELSLCHVKAYIRNRSSSGTL